MLRAAAAHGPLVILPAALFICAPVAGAAGGGAPDRPVPAADGTPALAIARAAPVAVPVPANAPAAAGVAETAFNTAPVAAPAVSGAPPAVATADGRIHPEIDSLMTAGDYAGARALALDMVDSGTGDAGVFSVLSQIYLTEEDAKAAVNAGRRAVELEPSVAGYRLWLARAYLLRAGQSALLSLWYAWKGKAQYEKAVELDPDNVEMRLELCLYYLLAPRIAGGSGDRAREQAARIEKQDPLFGAYAWAGILEKEKETGAAEKKLLLAVDLDTTSTQQARYALGYFYQRNRRYADAREVFGQILELSPEDMTAMYYIGTSYLLEEKDLDRAEEILKAYLESEPGPDQPSHAMAHWRLGMVYELRGESELALEHLERAVELAPQSREFKAALEAARKE